MSTFERPPWKVISSNMSIESAKHPSKKTNQESRYHLCPQPTVWWPIQCEINQSGNNRPFLKSGSNQQCSKSWRDSWGLVKLASAAILEYIPYIEYINLHRLILFSDRRSDSEERSPTHKGQARLVLSDGDIYVKTYAQWDQGFTFTVYSMTIYTHICSYDFRHILCKHMQNMHKQELNIQLFWCLVVTSCQQIPTNFETSDLKLWNKIVNLTDPASWGTSVCCLLYKSFNWNSARWWFLLNMHQHSSHGQSLSSLPEIWFDVKLKSYE